MVMLLSVALSVLLVINGASLTSHQEQTSHDLGIYMFMFMRLYKAS